MTFKWNAWTAMDVGLVLLAIVMVISTVVTQGTSFSGSLARVGAGVFVGSTGHEAVR